MKTELAPLIIIALVPLVSCAYDFLLWRTDHRTHTESLAPDRPGSARVLLALVPLVAMLLILFALGEFG